MTAIGEVPEWTYELGGQWYGPLSVAQLIAAANAGVLPPQTPVHNVRTRAVQPAAILVAYPPAPPRAPAPTRAGDDPGIRMLLPVGRSGWAIAAGYLGLVAWLIWPLGPFSIIAAELGRRQIAADPHKHGTGRVVLGYVGGVIGTLGIAWFAVAVLRSPT